MDFEDKPKSWLQGILEKLDQERATTKDPERRKAIKEGTIGLAYGFIGSDPHLGRSIVNDMIRAMRRDGPIIHCVPEYRGQKVKKAWYDELKPTLRTDKSWMYSLSMGAVRMEGQKPVQVSIDDGWEPLLEPTFQAAWERTQKKHYGKLNYQPISAPLRDSILSNYELRLAIQVEWRKFWKKRYQRGTTWFANQGLLIIEGDVAYPKGI